MYTNGASAALHYKPAIMIYVIIIIITTECQVNSDMVTFFRVFQVQSTQKWFAFPFLWATLGLGSLFMTTGRLFSRDAQ